MGFLDFLKGYNDDNIMKQVERAINSHPMLERNDNFSTAIKDGIIRLEGKVKNEKMKNRIEDRIKEKLEQTKVRYKKIENEIEVNN